MSLRKDEIGHPSVNDAVRDAREAILAVIAELKLAGIPVPIGLHKAARDLHYVLEDGVCPTDTREGAELSTRH
jgi:hypothetical protein